MEHGRRRKWCKKRTISWLMKQELTWDKAFRESTNLLHLFLIWFPVRNPSHTSYHSVFKNWEKRHTEKQESNNLLHLFLIWFPVCNPSHTSYYSVFSPSVICDTKLFNIHFDDLFRWTPFLILLLINIMSTNIIGQLKEYFSTCAEMRKTVIVVIFIVLFFPPYCANFSTHYANSGPKRPFYANFRHLRRSFRHFNAWKIKYGLWDKHTIDWLLTFCISARLLCHFFEAEITPALCFRVSECVNPQDDK